MRQRLLALIRKEFIQVLRDPRTLTLSFLIPIVMLFLLGYAATNDVRNIPLAVIDRDRSPAARDLLDAYRASDYYIISHELDNEADLRLLLDNGKARAGIIIPPGYGADIAAGHPAQVAFIIDGSDPTVAGSALSAAILIGQSHATTLALLRLQRLGQAGALQPPLEVRTQVWYNPAMVSANYMIPALIGMILQFLTTLLTATSIVREREQGTIEQLIITPLRSWELVVGKLTPYVIIAFLDTIEILTIGVLVFNIPINGSLGLLLLLSLLFLVTTLGIGLLISTIANTQQEAMLTSMMTILPSVFISGYFFPIAAMPQFLQWFSYTIPLRYFFIIVRGIVLKGVGVEALLPEILALSAFALLVMGATALRFRKRLD